MPKRTLYIQNPAKIEVRRQSLEISTCMGTARVPLEDIWVVIVESHETTMSAKALSEIADAGIGTMFCGRNHMPNGLLLPLGAHSRHAAIVEDQLLMSKPLKKQLWQRVVRQKILNQAEALHILGLQGSDALRDMAKAVLSNDSSGREAAAAALYFKQFIPNGTRRDSELTTALDYGYAVLRAGIGRCAVGGGWLVSRGIHHCNDCNAFNLADDFIEPFRPVVDLIVKEKIEGYTLNPFSKQILAGVFEYYVKLDGKLYTVQTAIEEMFESFKRCVLEDDASLLSLPELMPLTTFVGADR